MQRYFQNFMAQTRWNRYFLFQNLFPKIPHSRPCGFWNAGAWFMGIGLGIGILGIQLQWECGMWISRRRWSRIWNWIGLIQSLLGLQSTIRISYGLRTLPLGHRRVPLLYPACCSSCRRLCYPVSKVTKHGMRIFVKSGSNKSIQRYRFRFGFEFLHKQTKNVKLHPEIAAMRRCESFSRMPVGHNELLRNC